MTAETTTLERALDLLGDVLFPLAELSPNDLDEAVDFYNEARPNERIEPEDGWVTKLVTVGPADWRVKS